MDNVRLYSSLLCRVQTTFHVNICPDTFSIAYQPPNHDMYCCICHSLNVMHRCFVWFLFWVYLVPILGGGLAILIEVMVTYLVFSRQILRHYTKRDYGRGLTHISWFIIHNNHSASHVTWLQVHKASTNEQFSTLILFSNISYRINHRLFK
jgi:hypothetical protein